MFKPENITIIPDLTLTNVIRRVRYWDKAGTEKRSTNDPAFTCGCLMSLLKSGRPVIEDIVRGQWESGPREARIRQVAEMDGKDVTVVVEQEPGSGGKESAQNTIRNLLGFNVKVDRVTGSKEKRAEPLATQVYHGNVSAVKGEYLPDFLKELRFFPVGKFKDQVDAASGAFNHLALGSRAGSWGRQEREDHHG